MPKSVVNQLADCILRYHLWATPEETAEWLKTERGQLIAALIRKEEERIRKEG